MCNGISASKDSRIPLVCPQCSVFYKESIGPFVAATKGQPAFGSIQTYKTDDIYRVQILENPEEVMG